MTGAGLRHGTWTTTLLRRWVDGLAGPLVGVSVGTASAAVRAVPHHGRDARAAHPTRPVWDGVLTAVEVPRPGWVERLLSADGCEPRGCLGRRVRRGNAGRLAGGMIAVLAFVVTRRAARRRTGGSLFLVAAPLIPVAGVAAGVRTLLRPVLRGRARRAVRDDAPDPAADRLGTGDVSPDGGRRRAPAPDVPLRGGRLAAAGIRVHRVVLTASNWVDPSMQPSRSASAGSALSPLPAGAAIRWPSSTPIAVSHLRCCSLPVPVRLRLPLVRQRRPRGACADTDPSKGLPCSHTASDPTVQLRGASKAYRGVHALHDVDLDLYQGVVGLLGPNGAGKTTLLRILATVLGAEEGRVRASSGGTPQWPPSAPTSAVGSATSRRSWDTRVASRRTASSTTWLCSRNGTSRNPARAEVRRVLDQVALTDRSTKRIRALSGGQRRRVGLAQALLGTPQLLVLDEPTTGLDPEQRVSLRHALAEAGRGSTVVVATHQTEDVAALCDRVIVLDRDPCGSTGRSRTLVRDGGGTRLAHRRRRPARSDVLAHRHRPLPQPRRFGAGRRRPRGAVARGRLPAAAAAGPTPDRRPSHERLRPAPGPSVVEEAPSTVRALAWLEASGTRDTRSFSSDWRWRSSVSAGRPRTDRARLPRDPVVLHRRARSGRGGATDHIDGAAQRRSSAAAPVSETSRTAALCLACARARVRRARRRPGAPGLRPSGTRPRLDVRHLSTPSIA